MIGVVHPYIGATISGLSLHWTEKGLNTHVKNEGIDMNEFLIQIIGVLLSGIGASLGLTNILKYIQKGKDPEPDISEKIEKVASVLSQSSAELVGLQRELEGKLDFVNKLNEQANQAQSLLSLSHDQIEAIRIMLNHETQKENRISFWKGV